MYCTDLTKIKVHNPGLAAEPLRCKCWPCEHCQPILQRQVRAKALAGNPTRMLTLTLRPDPGESPAQMAKRLTKARAMLFRQLKREGVADRIPFMAVLEAHKSGYPHLHMLVRSGWLPVDRIRGLWRRLTGSHRVHITALRTRRYAARYVAKYLTKQDHRFDGCKRWWRSHDYDQTPDEVKNWRPAYDVVVIERAFPDVQRDAGRFGLTTARTVRGHDITLDWRIGIVRGPP